MTESEVELVLSKIIGQVFGYKNPFSIEQFMQKYTFDIRLPQQVLDSTTGEPTWTQSVNPTKFISVKNAWARDDWDKVPKKELKTIADVLSAWELINYTVSDRLVDSINVSESDNVYSSENVFRSQDVISSKNVLLSDGVSTSEYIVAGQRSNSSTYCIRLEDCKECSNSFSVIWSDKVVNSFFIQDCSDLFECMFCSHISSKKYCIANMQYEEEEYRKIKDLVIRWILTG